MQNKNQWKPSKFVYQKGRLAASRDPAQVGVSSRLISDIIASIYDQNLKQHARGKLLDLGCGFVPLYAAYKDFVTDITCVDWANSLHNNQHLDQRTDLTKDLPFADDQFDTVILSDVLEHIPTPEHLWREIVRILAKNGKLVMNVPFYYWLHEEPHDYYRYTEFALRRLVEQSGMQMVQLSSIGGAPEIMADIFAKNAMRLPKIGSGLARFAQWFAWNFVQTSMGKKISVSTGKQFPLGYFLVAQKPA